MTWTVLGDSVIGTSHRTRSTPCQDAFRIATFGPSAEWLVVAVADGAGSASRSEVGATMACDEFARRVEAVIRLGGVGNKILAVGCRVDGMRPDMGGGERQVL